MADRIGIGFILYLILLVCMGLGDDCNINSSFNRDSFPNQFIFGTASSAYQYEGAASRDEKGPSIWDTFTHSHPDKVADRSNADIAEDFYYRYKEDIKRMKQMGMDAFRLSISWSRILPNGSLSGGVNKQGLNFYTSLIDELISNGLQPFVTIFHFDMPQALEDQYGGFLSDRIIADYVDYAEVLFKGLGERVKYWTTFNEAWTYCSMGYAAGTYPPLRCSSWEVGKCGAGDSGTEPYLACHNILLAHGAAVKLYRDKYQAEQKGKIGMTVVSHWFLPYSDSNADTAAVQRSLDFMFGWFMDPLTQGEYPNSMRVLVGNRLPNFTKEQSKLVNGSYDFIGINYYATNYAYNIAPSEGLNQSCNTDSRARLTGVRNGIPLGPQAVNSSWFYIYPPGIKNLLMYTKTKYNNPVIYITENGVSTTKDDSLSLEENLSDEIRIEYHYNHLMYLRNAIRGGVDVRGYFVWSFMDDFEWSSGFTHRFGLNFVDFSDNLQRYPKKSANWFSQFLKSPRFSGTPLSTI